MADPPHAMALLRALPHSIHDQLNQAVSLAERCLITARYFGDPFEVRFWSCVSHYGVTPTLGPFAENSKIAMADVRETEEVLHKVSLFFTFL